MSNMKLLTGEELEYINNEYVFTYLSSNEGDKYIMVTTKRYPNRNVLHPITKNFTINTRLRRISINVKAINFWIEHFKDEGFTLLDVQHALNQLEIMYQEQSEREVRKKLNSRQVLTVRNLN